MVSRVKLLASTLNPVGSCIDSLIHTCNSLLYFSQEKQRKLAGVNTINESYLHLVTIALFPPSPLEGVVRKDVVGLQGIGMGSVRKLSSVSLSVLCPKERFRTNFG